MKIKNIIERIKWLREVAAMKRRIEALAGNGKNFPAGVAAPVYLARKGGWK